MRLRVQDRRFRQSGRSARHEDEARIGRFQQQRDSEGGEDVRPSDVDVPGLVESFADAQASGCDCWVESGAAVVEEDVEAAVLSGDGVNGFLEGIVGCKVHLDDA